MPYDQNYVISDIHFSTTFNIFLERIRSALGLRVANRSLPRGRQIELTEPNLSLLNAWTRWVGMGLSENTVVTMDALFHRRDDGYVESITFSCRTPMPPTHVVGDCETVDATRHTPPPPTTISPGASGAPQPSVISRWLQSLDTALSEANTALAVTEIGADALAATFAESAGFATGAFVAEATAATIGTLGAVVAIPAGVCVLADATNFSHQVAYYRGFVLAIADMAEPRDPTARRDEAGHFHNGRAAAVRFINNHRDGGVAFLGALWHYHPNGQARVNHLWNDILQNRFTTEHDRNLARPLRPIF